MTQDGDGIVHGEVIGHDASPAEMREIAENRRSFRTWATVLLRAAGPRLTEA